jgi:rSAM/selenodomain-associated transferase 1
MTNSEQHRAACLCVFARAPVPGKVKTRLLPYLDAESACQLHQQLIDECLSRTVRKGSWQSQLWSTDLADEFLVAMSRVYDITLHEQQGRDLGERMAHAVKMTLQNHEYVVLIGTDCPGLDAKYIEAVLQYLQTGADCVLGPAEDGGYVMLALSIYDDSLFNDIEWGTSRVLAATRERIKSLGWHCHEMPVLWDVDRPADFERLKMIDDL